MDTLAPQGRSLEEANALLRELWAQLERAQGALREQSAALVTLRREQAGLRERVAALEVRLGRNSSNSSRSPSSDPPSAPAAAKRPPSGRKQGGQPGHPSHQQVLLPPERVDHVVQHWPEQCRRCGLSLPPDPALIVAEPIRHQRIDVPPVHAQVTEHHLQRLRCPCCGAETRAPLPATAPPGAFGPRLQALVALLVGRYRLSRRAATAVCAEVLGVPLALGSVAALCRDTADALAQPMAELEQAVQAAATANADETSWKQAGRNCWLWVVVAATATVFRIAAGRGSTVLQGLLGEEFAGVVGSDRWTAYIWLGTARRQVCWAHLKRDFQDLVDRGGAAKEVGEPGLALVARIFAAWHQARDDPAAQERLLERMRPIQEAFRSLLETGQASRSAKAAGLCRSLLALWPALWTFVTVPGVEPTNNAAERALRPAVLWRKQSFGTRCDDGNRFVERLLSVTETCRQQRRPVLDYLTAVCSAAQLGQPSPALLTATP